MDEITKDDILTILQECLDNGKYSKSAGPDALWAWFLSEQDLIEQTLFDIVFEDGGSVI